MVKAKSPHWARVYVTSFNHQQTARAIAGNARERLPLRWRLGQRAICILQTCQVPIEFESPPLRQTFLITESVAVTPRGSNSNVRRSRSSPALITSIPPHRSRGKSRLFPVTIIPALAASAHARNLSSKGSGKAGLKGSGEMNSPWLRRSLPKVVDSLGWESKLRDGPGLQGIPVASRMSNRAQSSRARWQARSSPRSPTRNQSRNEYVRINYGADHLRLGKRFSRR